MFATAVKKFHWFLRIGSRKASFSFNDVDYLDRLNKKERTYIKQFLQEYYENRFSKNSPIHAPKSKARRALYGADDARRRTVNTAWILNREPDRIPSESPMDALVELVDGGRKDE